MKNYPTIKSSLISFKATILKSVVPIIEDKNYTVNTSPLSIQYNPFKVLPDQYDPGPSSVKAFEFTGDKLPTEISLSCDCLTSIENLDWITFEPGVSFTI